MILEHYFWETFQQGEGGWYLVSSYAFIALKQMVLEIEVYG